MEKVTCLLKNQTNISFDSLICSDNTERIPLPPAPLVADFDPATPESNEEFIGRLKHMGKS